MSNKPKIIDLFCGLGGFSQGFEKAGFESVLAIDVWKDAIETYNYNRENKVAKNMDIKLLDSEMIKEITSKHHITGIIGGPPCQGFSTVGTRNVEDDRNFLYLEYYRVVKEVMPDFFVIENVKGLLTLNKGMFYDDIKERFGSLGYTIEAKILDASDYGVPQKRLRVFFVGLKNGKKFEFPEPLGYKISTKEALGDLPSLDNLNNLDEELKYNHEPLNNFQKEARNNSIEIYNHEQTKHTEQTIDIISKIKDGGSIKDLPEEFWNVRKYNKAFQRMNSQEPSHTVDTGHRNYFHYEENRVPSVRECCRLQSIPDEFIITGSKTSQYKQVGNCVPVNLAFNLASKIKTYLD
ncbi:DNA cytosine methyltransferase [Paraclostridium bifermentans]|uniref:DNA (cytosine-5-)-methyltransferase n=1 Tax=Paraclostridium bifermentans TaxID=1490 RepID=A0A5P3XBJ9_PARBF|nr:DNA cytosine methyltransferase [Paraclostridium bifermentans]QEZ68486.1 DNA cytosine methyltransferase [Paraclostridium bifermentans]